MTAFEQVRVLAADEEIANCVQGHPTQTALATSGIENDIRLWTPEVSSESGNDDKPKVTWGPREGFERYTLWPPVAQTANPHLPMGQATSNSRDLTQITFENQVRSKRVRKKNRAFVENHRAYELR